MRHTGTRIVVFTGAGVSAESGIKTFRDHDGLWENFDISEVATPEAWARNPKLVLDFYNQRRKQVLKAEPNDAHRAIASLEEKFDVDVITQNIDDLHERAGSTKVLHLHGEIRKSRSSSNPKLIYDIEKGDILWGETCEFGSQLRPHVVWFGEEVPAIVEAEKLIRKAEIMIIVGTSLNVYPAAGLVHMFPNQATVYLIDPGTPLIPGNMNINWIREKAGEGMKKIVEIL